MGLGWRGRVAKDPATGGRGSCNGASPIRVRKLSVLRVKQGNKPMLQVSLGRLTKGNTITDIQMLLTKVRGRN